MTARCSCQTDVAPAVAAARELRARRLARGEVKIERLGGRALRSLAQLHRPERLRGIDGLESDARVRHQRLLERGALAVRRDHQHGQRRALARQRAQRRQILHQAQGLRAREGGERLRHHLDGALQAREAQPAVLDEGLAQPGAVRGDDERARAAHAEPGGERRREQRHRVDAGEPRSGFLERVEPGGELLRVGERGEQQLLVAPLRPGDVAERERRGEPRVAVALREAPLHDRLAVAAAQGRHLLLVEILAGEIGHHREQHTLVAAQVLAERAHAEIVAGELRLELEPAAGARVEVVVLGGEIEKMTRHQNFILEMASYTGPSTESITQPRIAPSSTVSAGSIIACSLPMASRTSRL